MLANENGPQKVEGMVIIKRKAFWVKRYAKVENQTFSYKKDKSMLQNNPFLLFDILIVSDLVFDL
jgi:hypothetical protein